jgi:CHAT domain-containing protein
MLNRRMASWLGVLVLIVVTVALCRSGKDSLSLGERPLVAQPASVESVRRGVDFSFHDVGRKARLIEELIGAGSTVAALKASEEGIADWSGSFGSQEWSCDQGHANNDTTLLKFWLGPERSFLWVLTADSVNVFPLLSRREIEAAANRVNRLVSRSHGRSYRQQAQVALRALSDLIFSAAATSLDGHRLVVVPDGELISVPFAVLPIPNSDNEYFIDRFEIVYAHSVVEARGSCGWQFLPKASRPISVMVGDPLYTNPVESEVGESTPESRSSLPALPGARRETETIRTLLSANQNWSLLEGGQNTSPAQALRSAQLVHLAAHGSTADPGATGLVFRDPGKGAKPVDDRSFSWSEILDLNLEADLVVLSACRTAVGSQTSAGRSLGLSEAFLQAGAGSTLGSLWNVEDQATAELMVRFYENLIKEGLPPATALQRAQKSLRQQPQWEEPYYWGGFILQVGNHSSQRTGNHDLPRSNEGVSVPGA